METIYLAGGCLWGVQAFVKTIPGVVMTEAGRANGYSATLDGPYDATLNVSKQYLIRQKLM
ncbi:Peptide methionine sulfoxide reductase MsrA [Staphylococcus pseudintermedius]|nr:Peptide methionine sulfoxide reductase MsrA [Staphylococcus pseudintermedius]